MISIILGCHGFPNAMDPMTPSKWVSFGAKFQILVQLGIEKLKLLDQLTKRRVGGQNVVEDF